MEALIEFKARENRYPTRRDFDMNNIKPGKSTFYKFFGSMEKAIERTELYLAGELIIEDRRKEPSEPIKKGDFQCPFCGSKSQKFFDWATCKAYILSRFMNLIKKNYDNQDYVNAAFDCIVSVYGNENKEVESSLRAEGYYKAYQDRVNELADVYPFLKINIPSKKDDDDPVA